MTNRSGLTRQALLEFLALLDSDPDRAGARYELIRHKLISFFENNRVLEVEELADEVIDRTARRTDEGVPIEDVNRFVFGVASRVLSEHFKQAAARRSSIEKSPHGPPGASAPDPSSSDNPGDERLRLEWRFTCMERCLDALPPETRALLHEFYQGARRARIEARKALAARLGVARPALGIRIYRIRKALKTCLDDCVRERA
jgi:DNA-directed RNA polymerase specialized sigma24 family protein